MLAGMSMPGACRMQHEIECEKQVCRYQMHMSNMTRKRFKENVACRYQAHVECELRASEIVWHVDTIAHVCSYQKDKKLYDLLCR